MEEAFADGIEKAMIDMIRRACSTGRSGGPLSTPEQAEHLLDALGLIRAWMPITSRGASHRWAGLGAYADLLLRRGDRQDARPPSSCRELSQQPCSFRKRVS